MRQWSSLTFAFSPRTGHHHVSYTEWPEPSWCEHWISTVQQEMSLLSCNHNSTDSPRHMWMTKVLKFFSRWLCPVSQSLYWAFAILLIFDCPASWLYHFILILWGLARPTMTWNFHSYKSVIQTFTETCSWPVRVFGAIAGGKTQIRITEASCLGEENASKLLHGYNWC